MIRVTGRHALLVTVTLLALALLVGLGWARSYAVHSSNSCTNGCHTDRPAAHYASKGHGAIACQACHSVGTGVGLRLLGDRWIGKKSIPEHGAVSAARC